MYRLKISSLEFVKDLLTSALTSTNVEAYAQIVYEKAILRKLIKVNEEIANDCYVEKGKLEDILESAEKRIFDIVQKRNSGDLYRLKMLYSGHLTESKRHPGIKEASPESRPDLLIWIIRQQVCSRPIWY